LLALFAANAISLTGNVLTWIAVPWFVLETTGSATRTGLVGAVTGVAAVGAGILGGPIVDRVGHRRASVIADLASGLTVALIPTLYYTVGLAFPLLLALVFLGAVLDAPGMAARDALLPDLARRAGMPLERANALHEGIAYGSELAGPLLAAALFALLEPRDVLYLDAATFAVSAVLIAVLVPAADIHTPSTSAPAARGYVAELREGLAFIATRPVVRTLVTASGLTNFIGASLFTVVLLAYLRDTYGDAAAARLGLIFAAGGAGLVLGTVAFGAWGHRLPRRPILLASFAMFGLTLWPLALSPPFVVIVVLFVARGVATGPYNPLLTTILQEIVPASLRGRVFGAQTALAHLLLPLGFVVGGALTDAAGVVPTVLVMAGAYAVATAWLALSPATRHL
jgi:MFS family permease